MRGGKSLEDAARESQIEVRRSGWLTRRNPFVAGLGSSAEVVATAFVLATGKSSPRIFEIGDAFALVQLLERKEADPARVDALVEKKRDELLEAKRNARIGAWLEARRAELEKSGDLVVNMKAIRG